MPFAPAKLSQQFKRELEQFASKHDFCELYKGYDWREDTWTKSFPRILELERTLTATAMDNTVTKADVVSVVRWGGGARRVSGINCPGTVSLPLYEEGKPDRRIENNAWLPLKKLDLETNGLGPTSLSKVLRFAMPSEYGAIDTRLVRVVGVGDREAKQHSWLGLTVKEGEDGLWSISREEGWRKEYATWIDILRFFAQYLNEGGVACPHPPAFAEAGLRTQGVWYCADVEMALWSYASSCLKETSGG